MRRGLRSTQSLARTPRQPFAVADWGGAMSSDQVTVSDTAPSNPVHARNRTPLQLALMGLAGSSIEWYDFLLYGTAAALVFPTVFFPANLSPFVALIASFSTFAVGLVARPFGAVLFGHMGDTVGRKGTLATALILMGGATTLMAFLPSYRAAGVFAPLALALLRLLQGLAVGGQWGGATLLATENAPDARRGLFGSITQCGVAAGVLLANVAFLAASGATTPEAFMAYGWRIPFLLSIGLVGLGLYQYFRVDETAAFRQLQAPKRPSVDASHSDAALSPKAHGSRVLPWRSSPVLEALRLYPGRILLAAGVQIPSHAAFYVAITYVVAYGTSPDGLQLPRSTVLGAVMVSSVFSLPVTLLAGQMSDRVGRRRIVKAGVALMGVWAFALFALMETRSFLWICVALTVGGAFSSIIYGPLAALFAELFETRVRYSAISLAYQLSAIAGGAFAPVIATSLYARYHTNMWMAAYLAGTCAVSLACLSRLRDAAGREPADAASHPAALVVGAGAESE
jgi:MFS family permease